MNRFLLAAPIALIACSLTPTQLASDVQLIETGIEIIAPVLLAKAGITSAEVSTINSDVAIVRSSANAIVSATNADATLTVRTLVSAVQGVAPIAARYLPAGSQEAVAVQAAVALLPIVLQAAGVSPGVMAARVQTMPPAEARGVLVALGRR